MEIVFLMLALLVVGLTAIAARRHRRTSATTRVTPGGSAPITSAVPNFGPGTGDGGIGNA